MHPVLLDLGFFKIHFYGFFMAVGFFCAIMLARQLAKTYNIAPQLIMDLSLQIIIGAIVGSKLLFYLVNLNTYLANPADIIRDLRVGFIFFGGFILAVFLSLRFAKKHNLPLGKTADVLAPAIPLGHAFGRLGCTMAGCCYGRPCNHEALYTLTFADPQSAARPLGTPLYATQPISAVFLFILAGLLLTLFYLWPKRKPGTLLLLYGALYSIFRFCIEFLRGDPRGHVWHLSTSQIIAIPVCLVCLVLLVKPKRAHDR